MYEGILVNLMENISYHKSSQDSLHDNLIDLIEYVYVNLVALLNTEQDENESLQKIQRDISMSCLSILRYITDNLKHQSLSCTTYILNEKEILVVLVELIEKHPWRISINDKWHIRNNNQYIEEKSDDLGKVTKEEGQVWLTIYNLIFTDECARNYEINEFRKNNLLKLRKYLKDSLLDQIPVLVNLKKTLEELSIQNVSNQFKYNPFIISCVTELKKSLIH